MKKITWLLFLIVLMIAVVGCLGNNKPTDMNKTEIPEDNREIIKSIPQRETIKSSIVNAVSQHDNSMNAPRKTPGTNDYYFSLAKEKIDILGNNGTVEIEFIYIEDYQTDSEEVYQGSIQYLYDYQLTEDEFEWILSDTIVSFHNVETGSIHGTVTFLTEPVEGILVYGISNEEYTQIASTDINGEFTITDVLINEYDLVLFGESFPEEIIENVTVSVDAITEVGAIPVLPFETEDKASIFGYIYYDIFSERPVVGATVRLNDIFGNETAYVPGLSSETGYYVINGLTAGTYEIVAKTGKNSTTDEVIITEANYGSAKKIDNIAMLNSNPVVNQISPLNNTPVYITLGEKKTFYITAEDPDNDKLSYKWRTTGGEIAVNNNICELTTTDHGTYKITLEITDSKGGNETVEWEYETGWVEVKGASEFPGRYQHGAIVFNERMLVVAGNSGSTRNEVVYSDDNGKNWLTVTGMPWERRKYPNVVKYNYGSGEKLLLIGGLDQSGDALNDLWESEDGLNWTMITDEINLTPNGENKILVYDDGIEEALYSIGGWDSSGVHSKVWKSTDAINWSLVTNSAQFGQRYGHDCVVFNNAIFLYGGLENAYTRNDVWKSTDGINWAQMPQSDVYTGKHHFSAATDGNSVILGCGSPNNQDSFFVSYDGINFKEIENSPFPGRIDIQLFSNNGFYYMIGGYKPYDYTGFKEVWKIKIPDQD